MSSVIKINRSTSSSGIRLSNIMDSADVSTQTEEDYWKKKIADEQQKFFNKGREEAIAELEGKFAQNLLIKYADFESLTTSLDNSFADYEHSFEKLVVELSVQIAEQIIKREIADKTTVQDCIVAASKKLTGAENILIKINPADYELIKESSKGLFNDENFSKVKFKVDEKISIGGCFIESDIGNVDARISTQLAELKQKIEANYLNDSK